MAETSAESDVSEQAFDPTLDALAPKTPPLRNFAFIAMALLLLGGAWLSPKVLRLEFEYDGSSATVFESTGQILTATHLNAPGHLSIEAVPDLPGATVAGAWILDSVDYSTRSLTPDNPLEDLAERYPGQEIGPDNELPQTVKNDGVDVELVILWTVTECDQLDPSVIPEVTLRTAIGNTVQQPLLELSGPSWNIEWLKERGVCSAS